MATDPAFGATAKIGQANITVANPNLDGTGTIGTVITAGANGTEVYGVRIKARVTTTAGMIRLFLHDGTTYRGLLKEIPVPAITKSATVAAFEASVPLSQPIDGVPGLPLVLPNLWSLRAAAEKAESFDVIATGVDY